MNYSCGFKWELSPEAVTAATIITTVFITIAIIIVTIVSIFVQPTQLNSGPPSRSGAPALRIQRLLHCRL